MQPVDLGSTLLGKLPPSGLSGRYGALRTCVFAGIFDS